MGLRRLRGRLNQLQSHANQRMLEAGHLLQLLQDLVADVQDGVGIKVRVEPSAVSRVAQAIWSRERIDVPVTIIIDFSEDAK